MGLIDPPFNGLGQTARVVILKLAYTGGLLFSGRLASTQKMIQAGVSQISSVGLRLPRLNLRCNIRLPGFCP